MSPEPDMVLHALDIMHKQLDRIERRLDVLVPRSEFEAYKIEVDRRLKDVADHKSAEHGRLDHRIDAVDTRVTTVDDKIEAAENVRNTWGRDLNARVWLAVGAAVLGVLVSVVSRTF